MNHLKSTLFEFILFHFYSNWGFNSSSDVLAMKKIDTDGIGDARCTHLAKTMDIIFLIDGSSSSYATENDFRTIMKWVITMHSYYDTSSTQVGVVQYSSSSHIRTEVKLGALKNKDTFAKTLQGIKNRLGFGRETANAVKEVVKTFEESQRFSSAHKILVLVTYGSADDENDLSASAKILRTNLIQVISIGVMNAIENQLEIVTIKQGTLYSPVNYVITVPLPQDLPQSEELNNAICARLTESFTEHQKTPKKTTTKKTTVSSSSFSSPSSSDKTTVSSPALTTVRKSGDEKNPKNNKNNESPEKSSADNFSSQAGVVIGLIIMFSVFIFTLKAFLENKQKSKEYGPYTDASKLKQNTQNFSAFSGFPTYKGTQPTYNFRNYGFNNRRNYY